MCDNVTRAENREILARDYDLYPHSPKIENRRKYERTDKAKERAQRYNNSEKGKARWKRYYAKKKLRAV